MFIPHSKPRRTGAFFVSRCIAALGEAQLVRGQARMCRGGGGIGPARFGSYFGGSARAACPLSASAAVTAVIGYSSNSPLFFWTAYAPMQGEGNSPQRARALVGHLHLAGDKVVDGRAAASIGDMHDVDRSR